jgi:hypothetical protein
MEDGTGRGEGLNVELPGCDREVEAVLAEVLGRPQRCGDQHAAGRVLAVEDADAARSSDL